MSLNTPRNRKLHEISKAREELARRKASTENARKCYEQYLREQQETEIWIATLERELREVK